MNKLLNPVAFFVPYLVLIQENSSRCFVCSMQHGRTAVDIYYTVNVGYWTIGYTFMTINNDKLNYFETAL